MAKLLASIGAVSFYSVVATASVEGDIRQEPLSASELLGGEAPARAEAEEDAALQATLDATAAVPMQEMSDEEKERRRRVCDKLFYNCNDKCKRYYDNPRSRRELEPCRARCSEEDAECRKEIPS